MPVCPSIQRCCTALLAMLVCLTILLLYLDEEHVELNLAAERIKNGSFPLLMSNRRKSSNETSSRTASLLSNALNSTNYTNHTELNEDHLSAAENSSSPAVANNESMTNSVRNKTAVLDEGSRGQHQASNTSEESHQKVVCLRGQYGKNCNKIIQLANTLRIAHEVGGKVGLHNGGGPKMRWVSWYRTWFDPHEDILLDYYGNCSSESMIAKQAHFIRPLYEVNPEIVSLVPKESIRLEAAQQAKRMMLVANNISSNISNEYVSVHRRWLDGSCHIRATTPGENFCVGPAGGNTSTVNESWCDIVYNDVINITASSNNQTIILFTDGQQKDMDDTFPLRSASSFQVEMWMMTMSAVHIGVPSSSVDYVVNHWRRGRNMIPSSCFESIDFPKES